MLSFKNFLLESSSESAPWMPQVLHDFMFHLSSPMSHHHHDDFSLKEASIIDIHKGVRPAAPTAGAAPSASPETSTAPHSSPEDVHPGLVKTNAMIHQARSELPNENLHKRIGQGFKNAFHSMKTEDPKTSKQRLGESKKVYDSFAKSRGLKKGPNLLGGNMKTEKSSGEGVLTAGLSLAPHHTSGLHGFDVCPRASAECRQNCLGTTAGGNKQYPDTALSAKVFRTHFIAAHPEHAARLLDHEVGNHVKKAEKKGYKAGVRLNVTSDIAWEHHAPDLMHRHPTAQFYDYTKMHNRVGHPNLPSNYHLSLSHTGTGHAESNDHHVVNALEKGHVAAMVFKRGKDQPHPTHVEDVKTGKRYPVVNGDNDDNTFDRHESIGKTPGKHGHGVVSGLQLKGVKNEDAGHFANQVDHDGIIRINR
jgi:hypothetical protein